RDPFPTFSNAAKAESSDCSSVSARSVRIHAWARSDESSDRAPTNMTAGIPRRRSIMNAAIDRLRHKLFQGIKLAERDKDKLTSLISSAEAKAARAWRLS